MIELKCEGCGTITTALRATDRVFHSACPQRLLKRNRIPQYVDPALIVEPNEPGKSWAVVKLPAPAPKVPASTRRRRQRDTKGGPSESSPK